MESQPTEGITPEPTPTALTSKVTVTATEDCVVLIDGVSTSLAKGDTAEMTKEEADAYANLGLVEVGAGGKTAGDVAGPSVPRRR